MVYKFTKSVRVMPASFFHGMMVLGLWLAIEFGQTAFSYIIHADTTLSLSENLKRIHLIKRVVNTPQDLQKFSDSDIAILLKSPTLKRQELAVNAWHYHGESCALDIYFYKDSATPDYIEYRPLSMNADVEAQFTGADQSTLDTYCLKDIMETQGVDTPSNFATRPTPSWDNPYRT